MSDQNTNIPPYEPLGAVVSVRANTEARVEQAKKEPVNTSCARIKENIMPQKST